MKESQEDGDGDLGVCMEISLTDLIWITHKNARAKKTRHESAQITDWTHTLNNSINRGDNVNNFQSIQLFRMIKYLTIVILGY
jgi:hypothetical protein